MEEAFLEVMGQPNAAFGARPGGLPAFMLTVVSGAEGHTLSGPDGLFDGRVQVDAYGSSYGQAKRAAREAIAALNGHIGNGFLGIWHVLTLDDRENADSGALFRVSLDFTVTYRQEQQP